MSIALDSHTTSSGVVTPLTCSSLNVGASATHGVLAIGAGNGVNITASDNYGNSYTLIGSEHGFGYSGNRILYKENASVGSGLVVTLNGDFAIYASLEIYFFSGVKTSSSLDQYAGAAGYYPGGNFQPGSITPTEDGELIIASIHACSGAPTVDSGLTVGDYVNDVVGNYAGSGIAYKVQGTAAAINPTWGYTGNDFPSGNIASFKAGSSTQSYSYTAGGGLTFGGTASRAKVCIKSASGGVTFGGAAGYVNTSLQRYSYTPSGGLNLSGTATPIKKATRACQGGATFSGACSVSYHESTRTVVASGGLQLGGTAQYQGIHFGDSTRLTNRRLTHRPLRPLLHPVAQSSLR